ncbi:GNAT family N-acetyltransferase [Sphingobacterium sp. LRF_L2]|uniref:GNAT family N-acetyltransferase n=1 Tax=Sphingobacterium sp. LRF_L2 TaxID=3369421 RepID=UPI003F6103C0
MKRFEIVLNEHRRGELRLLADDVAAGKMDISIHSDVLTVYHTEVDPQFEGMGYAKLLLSELVRTARNDGLKIKPLCPYVHAQFKRHPDEYQDIWLKDE